jgi:hypothetical protein
MYTKENKEGRKEGKEKKTHFSSMGNIIGKEGNFKPHITMHLTIYSPDQMLKRVLHKTNNTAIVNDNSWSYTRHHHMNA